MTFNSESNHMAAFVSFEKEKIFFGCFLTKICHFSASLSKKSGMAHVKPHEKPGAPCKNKKRFVVQLLYRLASLLYHLPWSKLLLWNCLKLFKKFSIYEKSFNRIKMKIEAAILFGVLFVIQLIPSESAPAESESALNGKLINMYTKFISK